MNRFSIALLILSAGALAGLSSAAVAQSPANAGGATAAAVSTLTPSQATRRYQQGEALERQRNWRGSFEAYLEAGEAGDGLAQKKLGDLYSTGNPAVERDYENALRWYHKAREQGVEIPKPISYPGMPIDASRK